jgi:AhpD family alkylhydroperoxidase
MAQRLRYAELAPEGIAKLRAFEHYLNTGTSFPAQLLELLRLRASILNGCEFCIEMHKHELAKHHEPLSRVDAVADWQASDAFTPRERAALAWTDCVTNVQQSHVTDEEFAAISQFFQGKDLADLTLVIASINTWNRLAIPFRMEWNPNASKQKAPESSQPREMQDAVDEDGAKAVDE